MKSKTGFAHGQVARGRNRSLKSQSGQVIVEYILLLFIAVMAAGIVTKGLVSRNPENPGVITGAWKKMNDTIGADIID